MEKVRALAPKAILCLGNESRAAVKRDMTLIRKILLEVESWKDVEHREVEIEGYEPLLVARHVEMLLDSNFLEGIKSRTLTASVPYMVISDMSMEGHDFLAALKNDSVWAKMQSGISLQKLAELPLSVVKEVGIALATQWAKSQVGLP